MISKKTLPIVFLACLSACGAGPTDPAASPLTAERPIEAPSSSASMSAAPAIQGSRLVRYKANLYIHNVPPEVIRNRLYYMLAEKPIPGSTDYPKIGVVRVMDREGSSVKAAWWTLVDDDVEAALKGEGLRVELVGQDLEKRVGRHWTTFEVMSDSPNNAVIVLLKLGADDGVKSTDKYELFGEARADAVNLSVDDFTPLGTCTVLPFGADRGRARCQFDVSADKPKVGPGASVQRGYARAMTERVE